MKRMVFLYILLTSVVHCMDADIEHKQETDQGSGCRAEIFFDDGDILSGTCENVAAKLYALHHSAYYKQIQSFGYRTCRNELIYKKPTIKKIQINGETFNSDVDFQSGANMLLGRPNVRKEC